MTTDSGAPRFSQTSASRVQEDLSSDRLLSVLPRDGQGRPLLGRIALICRLGKGGMGAVYYGIHPRLQVEVAIKVLPFNLVEQDPKLVDRFVSEARMAAALASDHVVRVLDVDSDSDTHFLVMEYVAGETAGAYLKRIKIEGRPTLEEQEALEIVTAATKGLAAAHDRGIIHRDVKPDNILIPGGNRRKAKLADLGLAKPDGGGQSIGTASHVAMGTPGYMAPEQAEDAKTAGPAADVFSMGATLYALLSGKAPFGGSSLAVILRDTAIKDPVPLPSTVSAGARALVERCLAKDPKKRFANGAELLSALEGLQGSSPTPVTIPQGVEATLMSIPEAPRRRSLLVPIAVVAVLLIGGGIFLATRPGAVVPPPVQRDDSAQKAANEKARAEKITGAQAKADKGDLDEAVAALEGITGTDVEMLRVEWARRSKERKERVEKIGGILKQVESLEKDGRLDDALATLTKATAIDADDSGVKGARDRIETKIRTARSAVDRRKAWEDFTHAAKVAQTMAKARDSAEAWQAVVEAYAGAEANAADEKDKAEARAQGAEAGRRRDRILAHEAEAAGKLDEAIELARKGADASYLATLEAKKKTRDERISRKKDFDKLAAEARATKEPGAAMAFWKEAEKLADDETDKVEARKRIDQLSTEVAKLELEKRFSEAIKAGEEALAAGKFDEARAKFNEALGLKSGDPGCKDGLGRVEAARREKAHDLAKREGQAAFDAGDLDTADAKFREALKLKENDPTATDGLAKVEAAGRLKAYEAAMKLAEAALTAEKFDEAEAQVREALAQKPGDARASETLKRVVATRAAKDPVKYLLAFKPHQGDQIIESTVSRIESQYPTTMTKKWTTTYDSVEGDRLTQKTVIVDRWDAETTIDGKTTPTTYIPANSKCTVRRRDGKDILEGDIPEAWKGAFSLANETASIFPKEPVGIGETWDTSEAAMAQMPKNTGVTYTVFAVKVTLKEVAMVGGRKCATLDMHTKFAFTGTGFSGEGVGDSRYVMWLERGYAISSQSTTVSSSKIGDNSSKMTHTIESTWEIRDSSKK